MEKWIENDRCTGCGACKNICPVNALTLEPDVHGFGVVEINQDKCINCGRCKAVCPVDRKDNNENILPDDREETPLVYAAWSNDEATRFESATGGVFSEFARVIFGQNGAVCGAAYDDNNNVCHIMVRDEEGLGKIRQSKYVQCDTGFIYKEVESSLKSGEKILFCGTPCQVSGLYSFLGKDYDNLYTVDFLCRGVNSPLAYRRWLDFLEKEYGAPAVKVWFKNKETGWKKYITRVDFANGKKYCGLRNEDYYIRGFLENNLYIRPSCYDCNFRGFVRPGDITVGDFWKVDEKLDDDKGTNILFINSKKGEILLKAAEPKLTIYERTLEEVLKGNPGLYESPEKGPKSDEFMDMLTKGMDFSDAYRTISAEDTPLLSVIIPADNSDKKFIDALNAVLAQEYPNKEIIVAGYGEEEKLKAYVDECGDKIRSFFGKSKSNAINKALTASVGKYVHIIDAGDCFANTKTYTEVIRKMLLKDADIGMFGWRKSDENKEVMSPNAYDGNGDGYALLKNVCGFYNDTDKVSYGDMLWNKIFKKAALVTDKIIIPIPENGYGLTNIFWFVKTALRNKRVLFSPDVCFVSKSPNILEKFSGVNTWELFKNIYESLSVGEKADGRLYPVLSNVFALYEIKMAAYAKWKGFNRLYNEIFEHVTGFYESPWNDEKFFADIIIMIQNAYIAEKEEYELKKDFRTEKEALKASALKEKNILTAQKNTLETQKKALETQKKALETEKKALETQIKNLETQKKQLLKDIDKKNEILNRRLVRWANKLHNLLRKIRNKLFRRKV